MLATTKIFVLLACCLGLSMAASNDHPVPGGITILSGEELKVAEARLQTSLAKLAAGDGPNYKISKVHSGTRQVVSGFRNELDVDLLDEKNVIKNCKVSIWWQPWLPQGTEVTFECPGEDKVVKKHD